MTFAEEMARRGQVKHGRKGEPGYELLHPPKRRSWHITDDPQFALDPTHVPADNAIAIRSREAPGLYLTDNVERWVNGQGYLRPYVAEIALAEGAAHDERWAGEQFLPAENFDQAEVVRVIPIDAYTREEYGGHGWIEDRVGTTFDTEETIVPPGWGDPVSAHYPYRGYRYSGPDVRDMDEEEAARHARRWREAIGWTDEDDVEAKLAAQERWLEAKHGQPGRPGYALLHPRSDVYEVLTEKTDKAHGHQARLHKAFQQMYEMEYEAPDGSRFSSHLDETYLDRNSRTLFAGGHVEDGNGNLIGEWAREVDFTGDVHHVNHIDFILNKEHRGKGFGEAFLAHSEHQYAAAGIEEIRLTTGYATGGYAWARLGFDWDGMPDRVVSALANHWAYGDGSTDADRMLQSQAGGFVDRFDSPEEDDWPTPNEVAMLGHDGEHSGPGHGPDEMWLGKRLMLRSTWSGRKRVRSLVGVKSMPDRSQILARIEAQRHAELEAILAEHGHLGSEGVDWVTDDDPESGNTEVKLAHQQQWLETKAPEAEAAEAVKALERDEASLRQDIAIFVRRQRREVLETIRAGRPHFDRSRWDRELALTVETKLRAIIERAGLDPDSGPARLILLRWVVSALALNASTAVALEVAVARAQLTEPPPPEPTGPSPTAVAATVAAALLLMRGESPSGDGWAPDVEWLHHLVGLVEGETGYQEWVAVNVVFAEAVIALRRKLDNLGMGTVGGEVGTGQWHFAQGGGFDDDGEGLMGPAELRRATDAANEVFDRAEMEVGPRVALSLVSGARHQAELEKVRAAGVATSKRWYSSRDERVRPTHRVAHGQTVPLDQPFQVGAWPMMFPHDPTAGLEERIHCFPGDTLVEAQGVERAYKRWYEGLLITVQTAGGRYFSGTPNHPVATGRGWVPLGALVEGDDLICGSVGEEVAFGDPDVGDMPAPFSQVYGAWEKLCVVTHRIPGVDGDFHGDGMQGEVDVVGIDGELGDRSQAQGPKAVSYDSLTASDDPSRSRVGDGPPRHSLVDLVLRLDSPPHGIVGSRTEPGSFFGTGSRHPNEHGLAATPAGHSGPLQAVLDDDGERAVSVGEGLFGFTSEVPGDDDVHRQVFHGPPAGGSEERVGGMAAHQPSGLEFAAETHRTDTRPGYGFDDIESAEISRDRVLQIGSRSFSGHVFNLQTQSGYYAVAGGVLVHNCRCVMVFTTEFSVPFTQAERSPWKAARAGNMGTMAVSESLAEQLAWMLAIQEADLADLEAKAIPPPKPRTMADVKAEKEEEEAFTESLSTYRRDPSHSDDALKKGMAKRISPTRKPVYRGFDLTDAEVEAFKEANPPGTILSPDAEASKRGFTSFGDDYDEVVMWRGAEPRNDSLVMELLGASGVLAEDPDTPGAGEWLIPGDVKVVGYRRVGNVDFVIVEPVTAGLPDDDDWKVTEAIKPPPDDWDVGDAIIGPDAKALINAWLTEWESKHGNPGDPGYRLLHPNSRVPDRAGKPTGALARDIAKRDGAKKPGVKPTGKKPTAKPDGKPEAAGKPDAAKPRTTGPTSAPPGVKPNPPRKEPDDAPVKVTTVEEAVAALEAGKRVELRQPREVSTLIHRLHAIAQDAKAKGEKAPKYDLCKVSVAGTNLFCADYVKESRSDMPQLSGKPLPGTKAAAQPRTVNHKGEETEEVDLSGHFRQSLIDSGIKVERGKEKASYLKASQNELLGDKVAGMVSVLEKDTPLPGVLFTSWDNYIIDGHHRWAAHVGVDLLDNKEGDVDMDIDRIDLDIVTLLDRANAFAQEWGIPRRTADGSIIPESLPPGYEVPADFKAARKVEAKHGDPNRPGYHLLHPGGNVRARRLPANRPVSTDQRGRGVGVPKPNPDGSYPKMNEAQRTARRREVEAIMDGLVHARGTTRDIYTDDQGNWTAEREEYHQQLLGEMMDDYSQVPRDRQALMLGGLGGAGKSTSYTDVRDGRKVVSAAGRSMGIKLDPEGEMASHAVVNPDNFKELMARDGMVPNPPGVSPMESAALVHLESSYLAKRLAERLMAQGTNILHDGTMSDPKSTESRLRELKASGYHTTVAFISVRLSTSLERIGKRWADDQDAYNNGYGYGGRLVPSGVIRDQADPSDEYRSMNERVYDTLRTRSDLVDKSLPIFDNEVSQGTPPVEVPFGQHAPL